MASFQGQKALIFMALPQESMGLFEAEGAPIHYTGIGKVNATYCAIQLIEKHKPEIVINLGTAGSRKFPQGQIVEATRFVQRDLIFAQFSKNILSVQSLTQHPTVTCGTADFVERGEPAVACDVFDMEAYALAFVCEKMQVKFNCLKFISDSSDENVLKDWKKNLKLASASLLNEYKKLL